LSALKASVTKHSPESRPQFLAGDLALDFLNTRMRVAGEVVDFLQNDDDVLAWLEQAGVSSSKAGRKTGSLSLLHVARTLRENIRSLVEKRKAGVRGDPSLLNSFLDHAKSRPLLVWKKPRSLTIERLRQQDTLEAVLAPVAEAAAVLLVTADFNLVKRCEDETCVLWFCDQTKSHHRRWCSMLLCGNRHKVAAYRKRRRHKGA
jgi:predicted RNA-binding Zn ribbon-like protein